MVPSGPTATSPLTSGRRLLGAGLAILGTFTVLAGAAAPSAEGHAAFLESTPEPGMRLERSPKRVALEFTEPLNEKLTKVRLVDLASGEPVEADTRVAGRRQVVVRPSGSLSRGGYRVDWYTVSTLDGHPLEGAFSFGVRAPAPSQGQSIEQSPLARQGWLRIGVRGALYMALFFFAGGVMGAALLSRGRGPAEWLYPAALALAAQGPQREAVRARAWRRTVRAGWLAAGAAAAVAAVETYDASGGLAIANVNDYLLANAAGVARVLTVVAALGAALLVRRARDASAVATAAALLSIAFSGHANSAEPRALAVASDWTHLLAAGVWIGGIAQIAAAWLPLARRVPRGTRTGAMRSVMEPFGRVALPAFLVVAASGLVNALIELGEVPALWQTAYGRLLGLKIALVGAIALASYAHAMRLRPRILAANPHPEVGLERRHWRLLSAQPVLAAAVLLAAAALVVFPLPPRQLAETEAGAPEASCQPCPVPEPGPRQLAVAEAAGSHIVALWLGSDGRTTVRVFDVKGAPADVPLRVPGVSGTRCEEGCRRARVSRSASAVTVAIRERGQRRRAILPARWHRSRTGEARRLLRKAQRTMRRLSGVRIRERTSSGPGLVNTTTALLSHSRDRRLMLATFRWAAFGSSARWLGAWREGARRVARVAVLDRGTPTWYRLVIDRDSGLVLRERLITRAHFIDRRYGVLGD